MMSVEITIQKNAKARFDDIIHFRQRFRLAWGTKENDVTPILKNITKYRR